MATPLHPRASNRKGSRSLSPIRCSARDRSKGVAVRTRHPPRGAAISPISHSRGGKRYLGRGNKVAAKASIVWCRVLRSMTTFETARSSTNNGAAEAVDMPRRQVIAVAVLMCVPLPLLSLTATLVPLPEIVERAAATFVSVAGPVADSEERLIREKPVAVRSVEITYSPSEQAPVSALAGRTRRAESRPAAHRAPARRAASTVAVQADASRSRAMLAEASGGAAEPTTTSPAKTKNDPPTKGNPSKAAKTGRGSASARTPTRRGQGGDRGSAGARSGGRTNGRGAVEATPTGSSTQGGTSPPGSGNGQANQPTPNPGAGSSSSPVPSPASGANNGPGKP